MNPPCGLTPTEDAPFTAPSSSVARAVPVSPRSRGPTAFIAGPLLPVMGGTLLAAVFVVGAAALAAPLLVVLASLAYLQAGLCGAG